MKKEVNVLAISEFKATCLKVLEQVRQTGEPILITKRGEPVAYITPPPPRKPTSWLGLYRGEGKILGDIISPILNEEEWEVLSE